MSTTVAAAPAAAYDVVTVVLHWLTAFLVIAAFALALAPGVVKGSIALHNTLGLLLLVLVPLRAVWRSIHHGKIKTRDDSRALRATANAVHGCLYVMLVVVPVLGLMYVDAKGITFTPFGLHLPQVVDFDRELAQWLYQWKTWLAYGMLGLILVHAFAAIAYHHWLRRDDVLRSMLVPAALRPTESTVEPPRSSADLADNPALRNSLS